MKETKNRLNPENKKSTFKNHIFGNLNNVVDYHYIGNFRVFNDDITIEESLYTQKEQIKELKESIKELKQEHAKDLANLKGEFEIMLNEIIQNKVV